MATSRPTTVRSRALGALAVLVLALLLSLVFFVGRGGCAPANAFDRRMEELAPPAEFDATRVIERPPAPIASGPDLARAERGAAALAMGPVSGVIVDARTKEIVPHVEVVLSLASHEKRVVVGDDGRFASHADFPSGTLHAVVHDDGAVVGEAWKSHDASAGSSDWSIAIPIGPTISFASIDAVPPRVESWRARIVESALVPEIAAELEVVGGDLVVRAPSAARPDREWSWKLLRPGNRPWIRYARHEHPPNPAVRPVLEVHDDAMNRKGGFILKNTIGVQPPVDVVTRPFARARLRLVRAPANEKLPMRVVVYDTRDDPLPGAPTAPVFDEGVVDEKGEIEFSDLDGGTKHVVGWSREERVDHHVVVPPGPLGQFEVPVKRADRGARGRLKTGGLPWHVFETLHVVARPAVAEGRMRGWMATIERGWTIPRESIYPGIDAVAVQGEPSRPVRMRMSDRTLLDHRFEVDGRAKAEIVFGPSGSYFPAGSQDAGDPLLMFEGLEFAWSAWSAEKQPIFGDQSSFVKGEGETRTTKLDFEPGWGVQLVLRAGNPSDIQSDLGLWSDENMRRSFRSKDRTEPRREDAVLAAPPVVGVTLQVDGYDEAVSDAAGEIRLRRPFEPRQLSLVGRGWRLTALEHLPGKAPRYVAWLKRNP